MTNEEYHAHGAVSKSDLDLINRSPLHYMDSRQNRKEQTEAMLFGSVVHKLVLEPESFAAEYAVAPKFDRRTKAGKQAWQDFSDSIGNETVISEELYTEAQAVAGAVLANPIANKLLAGGQAEQSFFWTDAETGVECKCRPDYLLRERGLVIDLKTTENASPERFAKSAYDYRYHVQAWWYLHGLQQCGIDANDFVFVAVEKKPPYAVCVYAADDLMLRLGEMEAMENLRTYAECKQSGIWYGYEKEPEIHSLSLPDWVIRKYNL